MCLLLVLLQQNHNGRSRLVDLYCDRYAYLILQALIFGSPAKLWQRRHFSHATEKAGKQDWFKGVFEGAGMQEESPEEDCCRKFKAVSFK